MQTNIYYIKGTNMCLILHVELKNHNIPIFLNTLIIYVYV